MRRIKTAWLRGAAPLSACLARWRQAGPAQPPLVIKAMAADRAAETRGPAQAPVTARARERQSRAGLSMDAIEGVPGGGDRGAPLAYALYGRVATGPGTNHSALL